jgi:dolichol-phosphate mannosyltransferase
VPSAGLPSTVIVLPTYNEAENVSAILDRILRTACHPDVLVVDDSSPDGTGKIVEDFARTQPRVRLHTRTEKAGLGRAYLDGFGVAMGGGRYDVVVQMDADGSHDPADVDRLVAALADGDLAIGSRYVPGGSVEGWARHRLVLSRGGNVYAKVVLGVGIRDLTGGFKAWRAPLLARVIAAATMSDGYGFQIETTVRALSLQARVVEVPITFRERVAGQSKMSTNIVFEALRTVPRLRRLLHK